MTTVSKKRFTPPFQRFVFVARSTSLFEIHAWNRFSIIIIYLSWSNFFAISKIVIKLYKIKKELNRFKINLPNRLLKYSKSIKIAFEIVIGSDNGEVEKRVEERNLPPIMDYLPLIPSVQSMADNVPTTVSSFCVTRVRSDREVREIGKPIIALFFPLIYFITGGRKQVRHSSTLAT